MYTCLLCFPVALPAACLWLSSSAVWEGAAWVCMSPARHGTTGRLRGTPGPCAGRWGSDRAALLPARRWAGYASFATTLALMVVGTVVSRTGELPPVKGLELLAFWD